jgi:hypothetical protein
MVAPNAGNSCTYRRPGYQVVAIEKDPGAQTVEGDAEGIVPAIATSRSRARQHRCRRSRWATAGYRRRSALLQG